MVLLLFPLFLPGNSLMSVNRMLLIPIIPALPHHRKPSVLSPQAFSLTLWWKRESMRITRGLPRESMRITRGLPTMVLLLNCLSLFSPSFTKFTNLIFRYFDLSLFTSGGIQLAASIAFTHCHVSMYVLDWTSYVVGGSVVCLCWEHTLGLVPITIMNVLNYILI